MIYNIYIEREREREREEEFDIYNPQFYREERGVLVHITLDLQEKRGCIDIYNPRSYQEELDLFIGMLYR
jgi:hypothetical protein